MPQPAPTGTGSQQVAETATEAKLAKRLIVEQAYANLGVVVEKLSEGQAEFIKGRGFEVFKNGGPVLMEPVTGLVVSPGDNAGTADWMCDPQKGAMYLIETSPDVLPRVWSKQEASKKSSGTLSDLPPVSRVWVRVAA